MSILSKSIDRKTEALSKLNPQFFTAKDISYFFGFWQCISKFLCEMAVKQGYFERIGKSKNAYKISK